MRGKPKLVVRAMFPVALLGGSSANSIDDRGGRGSSPAEKAPRGPEGPKDRRAAASAARDAAPWGERPNAGADFIPWPRPRRPGMIRTPVQAGGRSSDLRAGRKDRR